MPINEERPTPDYKCAQAELYAGLDLVWDSQAEREAEFIAENTKYTAGLSVTKKAAIEAARVLPDGQARYATAEDLGIELEEDLDTVLGKWNSLDGYISKAFTGEHYDTRISEAGKAYYTRATKKNWEYVKQLLQSGKAFIATHSVVLLADGGMPPTFAATFDTVKTAFDTKYGEYMGARQTSQEQTDGKIEANNAIYKDGREMMEDGKHIFRKSASVRERFVWERVLELLTPSSGGNTAVLEGTVAGGSVVNVPIDDIHVGDVTTVEVETDGVIDIYGATTTNGVPGPADPFWTKPAGTETKGIDDFAALTGIGETRPLMNLRNTGVTEVHYKFTFEGLES